MARNVTRAVHGDDLLYRFFRDYFTRNPHEAREMAQTLLEATAIWFPTTLYTDWPVLVPWVVRDPECRRSRSSGRPEAWSAPDTDGYLRDDNSLIKALPRSLAVCGPPNGYLDGARIGSEFVASHVWRVVNSEMLASRVPLLNSFVPNLVWLPSQVAKLSDLEGQVVQQQLQATSYAIYRNAPVAERLRPIVEEAWALLPPPPHEVSVDPERINWFSPTERFLATRASRLSTVIDAFERIERGDVLDKTVVSNRYTTGLPSVSPSACAAMLRYLRRFEQRT